jgi:hypothetical protein
MVKLLPRMRHAKAYYVAKHLDSLTEEEHDMTAQAVTLLHETFDNVDTIEKENSDV